VRDYWRGQDQTMGEFAARLTGSSDLYEATGRRPSASINFVTCHDGFTLRDLVSYNEKHNEMNGEQNRDGADDNRSWNCGVEGETDDASVLALRRRQRKNLMATLLLSQGVPMLLAGDELGRTQGGNNNAYCQDNEMSWVDWHDVDEDMLEFVCRLNDLRRDHAVFRRHRFFQGRPIHGADVGDIAWFRPDGSPMSDEDWNASYAKTLGVFLNGDALPWHDPRGHPVRSGTFFMIFNAHSDAIEFTLPADRWGEQWSYVLDTARDEDGALDGPPCKAQDVLHVTDRSFVLLERADA
jgi:glycogen operon protein